MSNIQDQEANTNVQNTAPTSSAPTTSLPCGVSKSRRIILSESLAKRILDAAKETGNESLYNQLRVNFPHGCSILQDNQLPVRARDPLILARQAQIYANVVKLADGTLSIRKKAEFLLRERLRLNADVAFSHLLNTPAFSNRPPPHPQFQILMNQSVPKYVDEAATAIASLPTANQKNHRYLEDTQEKLSNIQKVLTQLKQNVSRQVNVNNTPTVNADWTVSLKDGLNTSSTSRYSSPGLPIMGPPALGDEPDDPLLSPFITPRSKTRKHTARSTNDMDPIRCQLPR